MTLEEKRARHAEVSRRYYARNKVKHYARVKAWKKAHTSRVNEIAAQVYQRQKEKNPEKIKRNQTRRGRKYYLLNKEKCIARALFWQKVYRRTGRNPLAKLKDRLRSRVLSALKGTRKARKTFDLIGCTPQFLKQYLESKFEYGMSWEPGSIEIDHIKPCAAFDLTDPIQQKLCFHYTNLQPLWPSENRRKGASYG